VRITEAEQAAMHRALALAETVRGRTSPNPAVGAVLIDTEGRLVGEGATAAAGGPHAEIVALAEAGEKARGGTAVVTLEPCAHTGRTGPCTEALVKAGLARVIYAVDDPNPEAAGGAERLRAAGLEVIAGVESHAAASGALRPWLHAVRTGRPYVTWKFAATLDGRVAAADYTSRWISSAASRADAHRCRGAVDAVLVGSGTVLADDPHLTVRAPDGTLRAHQPLRVVVDGAGQVPATARVRDAAAETWVVTADSGLAPDGRHVDLQKMLEALHGRGVRSVLLEGGPTLAGAFLRAGLVDRVVAYVAPKLLGAGPAALGPAGVSTIGAAIDLDVRDVTQVGPDLRLTATVKGA
jgi:diaminohydroxyphosphoribosylaminopyrimidine deaminase / 5-amino-6-(5-phosphoribosylamino)uracil reductase